MGAIIGFVALLGRIYGPFSQLTNLYVDIKRSTALFERIFDYFDMEPAITDKPGATPADLAMQDIVFDRVGFTYQQDKQALQNISFTADAGTMTALVGQVDKLMICRE